MIKLGRASKPLDLMNYLSKDIQPSIFWVAENDRQGMLTIFNWTDKPRFRSIEPSILGLPALKQHRISDVFDGNVLATPNPNSFDVELPPHSARVLKIVDLAAPEQPPVIKVEHMASARIAEAATFHAQPASSNDVVCSY